MLPDYRPLQSVSCPGSCAFKANGISTAGGAGGVLGVEKPSWGVERSWREQRVLELPSHPSAPRKRSQEGNKHCDNQRRSFHTALLTVISTCVEVVVELTVTVDDAFLLGALQVHLVYRRSARGISRLAAPSIIENHSASNPGYGQPANLLLDTFFVLRLAVSCQSHTLSILAL